MSDGAFCEFWNFPETAIFRDVPLKELFWKILANIHKNDLCWNTLLNKVTDCKLQKKNLFAKKKNSIKDVWQSPKYAFKILTIADDVITL